MTIAEAQRVERVEVEAPVQAAPKTRFHERLIAEELTIKGGDGGARVVRALSEAKVDLNPHQIEAASFAIDSLDRGGCMLADEVGLGKTIEAGIVIAQMCSEGRGKVLILAPATLRAQWQAELREKFDLESYLVDGRTRTPGNPFDQPGPVIASIPFAAARPELLRAIDWQLVVIDEAHRLRNAHKPTNKTGKALRSALERKPKLLLTATPLQNDISELFGLLSLLDDQILGPEDAFKARFPPDPDTGGMSDSASAELKDRLAPVVQRTLRRQVREYVKYTNRRSVVEDFAPSPEEQSLYEDVSEYLRRDDSAAIDQGKRTLLTLVFRKLLASSTHAIAPTLERLAASLARRIEAAKKGAAAQGLLYSPDEVSAFSEEAEEWLDSENGRPPPTIASMQSELFELQSYAERAKKLTVNAKGEALKRAIDRIFTVARAHQWPQKAVIFTESRRTQDYLFELLSKHGYAGKVAVLSGDAGSPEERAALVKQFRDEAQILLSTEAGAEGLNLQFCNLVVNYDLPWNPQRVEQRIGRCHRYGQLRDVMVLNFLNRQNAADARLYELLEKKLNLFDGVFGASDEILGALESGVDFERRILDIYQSCREPTEIDAAFDALRGQMERRIDKRMTDARSMLLERFDGDVRRRLKIRGDEAKEKLNRRKASAQALTRGKGKAVDAANAVKQRTADPVSYLKLDAGALPPKLAHLAGKDGWWFTYRFELTGLKPEDRLVHLVLTRDGEKFRALPIADSDLLVRVNAQEEMQRKPPPVSVAGSQETALVSARDEVLKAAERASAIALDDAKERADRYAEDCLLTMRNQVDEMRVEWESARRDVAKLRGMLPPPSPTDLVKARAATERAEREYRKKLSQLRLAEDQRYQEKDKSLATLAAKAKVAVGRSLVASAWFCCE